MWYAVHEICRGWFYLYFGGEIIFFCWELGLELNKQNFKTLDYVSVGDSMTHIKCRPVNSAFDVRHTATTFWFPRPNWCEPVNSGTKKSGEFTRACAGLNDALLLERPCHDVATLLFLIKIRVSLKGKTPLAFLGWQIHTPQGPNTVNLNWAWSVGGNQDLGKAKSWLKNRPKNAPS